MNYKMDIAVYCVTVSIIVVGGIYLAYRGYKLEKQRMKLNEILDRMHRK